MRYQDFIGSPAFQLVQSDIKAWAKDAAIAACGGVVVWLSSLTIDLTTTQGIAAALASSAALGLLRKFMTDTQARK